MWEMGFPVSAQTEVKAPLEKKEWKFKLICSAIHKGPYEETGKTLSKMFEWMKANKLKPEGPVLERYLTMPTPDTKPEDLRTEVWHACKKVENLSESKIRLITTGESMLPKGVKKKNQNSP